MSRSRGSLETPVPQAPNPGDRARSLTRDIQRPSPCTSCTGVGLLAGFSPSPLILAPQPPAEESGVRPG